MNHGQEQCESNVSNLGRLECLRQSEMDNFDVVVAIAGVRMTKQLDFALKIPQSCLILLQLAVCGLLDLNTTLSNT